MATRRSDPEIGRRAYKALADFAEDQGLSLAAAAEMADVDLRLVYIWRDGHDPSAFNLQRLGHLGLDVAWIVGG